MIVEGEDIYGDGVNIAARIEALADAGGVFVSNTVHDHVRDRLPFAFKVFGKPRCGLRYVDKAVLDHPCLRMQAHDLVSCRLVAGDTMAPIGDQLLDRVPEALAVGDLIPQCRRLAPESDSSPEGEGFEPSADNQNLGIFARTLRLLRLSPPHLDSHRTGRAAGVKKSSGWGQKLTRRRREGDSNPRSLPRRQDRW